MASKSLHISHSAHATQSVYWLTQANDELRAADVLWRASTSSRGGSLLEQAGLHIGLAIENFVKGAWVENFPKDVIVTRRDGTKGMAFATHDLSKLFADLGIKLTGDEENLLEVLEGCVKRGYPSYSTLTDDNSSMVNIRFQDGSTYTVIHERVFTVLVLYDSDALVRTICSILNKVLPKTYANSRCVAWQQPMPLLGDKLKNVCTPQMMPLKLFTKFKYSDDGFLPPS